MSAWKAIILGLVQGLTEFLPVSSSGHLVIAQSLLGIEEPALIFDVFVHLGTLVAVFAAFWPDIWGILKRPFRKITALLLVACIPTALMGVLLNDFFTSLFSSLTAVALALCVTGVLLWISDYFHGRKNIEDMNFGHALTIGFFQGCAITPGLSRSGSTIFGALLCGLKRSEAAKFSFILSIPAILGAGILETADMLQAGTFQVSWAYILGAAVAAVSGYWAIRFFIKLLEKAHLRYFSLYCWLVAAIVLLRQWIG
ncbi:MAG: undecaprenyl-diphosphate phosphatase [Firmicutes bacterium]|nr:undecaprenyl-diphosphate phosphatase [Bacillota bacterium]